jgi:hypothetical protein
MQELWTQQQWDGSVSCCVHTSEAYLVRSSVFSGCDVRMVQRSVLLLRLVLWRLVHVLQHVSNSASSGQLQCRATVVVCGLSIAWEYDSDELNVSTSFPRIQECNGLLHQPVIECVRLVQLLLLCRLCGLSSVHKTCPIHCRIHVLHG